MYYQLSHYHLTSFLNFGHKTLNFRYHLGIIGLRPVGSDQLLVPLTGAVVSGVQLISGDLYALVAGILSQLDLVPGLVAVSLRKFCILLVFHELDISALICCIGVS